MKHSEKLKREVKTVIQLPRRNQFRHLTNFLAVFLPMSVIWSKEKVFKF